MAYPVSEPSDHGSRRKFGIEFQRSCRLTCANNPAREKPSLVRIGPPVGKTVAMPNKIPLEGSFLLNGG